MSYSIYIMRVSGCPQARGLRKIGVAKNVELRRQGIENSLRKEFGKNVLVYVEHAYELPSKGKGGFKAYNLEHQIQTYLFPKRVNWINMPRTSAGRSEWFRISTPLAKKYLACASRWVKTHFVGLPTEWERKTNGQLIKKGVY